MPTLDRPAQPSSPAHRRDIDGLRALAVCAVILVHAGVREVSGGFLGVDVFFVISGYLIHGNISRDIGRGTYNPLAFYGRRLRRTLPALFAVILATLAVGYFLSMPGEFEALAKSAIAAALSVSNILFLNEVGYFDHDVLTKPLLHTWSLGVEEQFYLLAPFLSVALYRARASIRSPLFLALILVGLLGCVLLQRAAPAAAFYLMPSRIWEFLIGCAIAEKAVPKVGSKRVAEAVTLASLVGLVGAFVLCSEASAHPGLPTVIPCVATAAIIHVGGDHQTWVGRLLANPVARFLGLISYSLYLWHWPLIVLATDLVLPHTVPVIAGLLVVLVVLSALSWRFIEQPFRDPASYWRIHARPVLVGGVAAILASAALVVAANGAPSRFPPDIARVASYFDYAKHRNVRDGVCFLNTSYPSFSTFDKGRCLNLSATKPNYIIMGDSLAAHTWIGLSTVMTDINVMQATASGCKPILDTYGKRYCTDLVHYMFDDYIKSHHVDGIIFSGAWQSGDGAAVAATVAYVKQFVPNVFVIGPCPYHDVDLPTLIGRSRLAGRPDLVQAHLAPGPWAVEAEMKAAIGDKATFVSQLDLLCPERKCIVLADHDVPIQYDKSHMTTEGSMLVARLYKETDAFAPRKAVSQARTVGGQ